MIVYSTENYSNKHIDDTLVKKLTNCRFELLHSEIDEIKENSLFITDHCGFHNEISDESKLLIKNLKNKALLLLHHGKSSTVNSNFLPTMREFIENYRFDYNKVFLITQLQTDISKIKQYFDINVISYDRWLHEFFDFEVYSKQMKTIKISNEIQIVPTKKFSIFCKRYEKQRLEIFCNLISYNLLDNFHYTFLAQFSSGQDEIINDIPLTAYSRLDKIKEWIQHIPYQVPFDGITEIYQHWNYPYGLENYLKSSKIHIVLETEPTESSYITEKTYRAIFYKKPFILISQYNALESLKAEGFKTFSPFIDESYDKMEKYEDRLNFIINEIKRLNELPESELDAIVKNCDNITEHNLQVLYDNAYRPIPDNFKIKNILTF